MTCYVFGGGVYPPELPAFKKDGLVIAADSGYERCLDFGIQPQLLVGDFDSLTQRPVGIEVVQLPCEKDVTDMVAAVEEGVKRGATTFMLLGGTGGRPDHTFANYQFLAQLASRDIQAYLVGERFTATCITDGSTLTFDGAQERTVSVFSLSEESYGVTIEGMHYPLQHATLKSHIPLGVSNVIEADGACVSVKKGCLLVMWEGTFIPHRKK